MVPDAGYKLAQLRFEDADIEGIAEVDISSEFQRLHLECADHSSFNRCVSSVRNKVQRWAAMTDGDVVFVATKALSVMKKAAVAEGLEDDWVAPLSLYVAKQVSSLKQFDTPWHKDRNIDLKNALQLFLKSKDEEAASVGVRAQLNPPPVQLPYTGGKDPSFHLWSKLPLPFGEEWKAPTLKVPYLAFRARMKKSADVYGLPPRSAQYFLIRNLGGALRELHVVKR